MISIKNQSYISEKGRRDNNEDNGGYNNKKSYVVCDGVGGSDKGEIASEIVVRRFLEDYNQNAQLNAEDVLKRAEDDLSAHILEHPDTMGMATTLTFSQVRDNGVYVAWVGDSRIYQFREGKIVFVTTDHSWVNEALKAGILSPEEAINHPKSNIITRAVQGSHKAAQIDDVLLIDVQKGDIFLHCSDGVLEAWDDDALATLFESSNEPELLSEKIKEQCEQFSRDNFTAIVYAVESSDLPKPVDAFFVEAIPVDEEEIEAEEMPYETKHSEKKASKPFFLKSGFLVFLLLIVASTVFLLFFNQWKTAGENDKTAQNAKTKTIKDKNSQTPTNTNPSNGNSDTKAIEPANEAENSPKLLSYSFKNGEVELFIEVDISDTLKPKAVYYIPEKEDDKKALTISKNKDAYYIKGKFDKKNLTLELLAKDLESLIGKLDNKSIKFKKIDF